MAKQWDKCEHCNGGTTCDCGSCRVYLGQGYEHYASGSCSVCGGRGGEYIDSETGHPIEGSIMPHYPSSERRR